MSEVLLALTSMAHDYCNVEQRIKVRLPLAKQLEMDVIQTRCGACVADFETVCELTSDSSSVK